MDPISVPFRGSHFFINDASPTCRKRAMTFATKEPDTVKWIEELLPDDIVWDIGANIGIYTIPIAMMAAKVMAFEPHPANYLELANNILLNGTQNAVPFAVALARKTEITKLYMSGNHPGVAMNTIGEGYHGTAPPTNLPAIPVMAMSGYQVEGQFGLKFPTAIKLDVDGIEFDVLRGLPLFHCRTLIVEVDITHPFYMDLMMHLSEGGYRHDPEQAERARRTSGPNKGVGNIVFKRDVLNGH